MADIDDIEGRLIDLQRVLQRGATDFDMYDTHNALEDLTAASLGLLELVRELKEARDV